MILKNHTSVTVGREGLCQFNKPRKEASRNKLVKESGMPDRVGNFGNIDTSKDCPRARLGFVKPIRNGLTKDKELD